MIGFLEEFRAWLDDVEYFAVNGGIESHPEVPRSDRVAISLVRHFGVELMPRFLPIEEFPI